MINRITRNIPQIIIVLFVAVLLAAALSTGMELSGLANDMILRLMMNGLLALSLLPMMKSGAGINFGLPIGAVAGLLGMVISIQAGMKGLPAFAASVIISIPFAAVSGLLYGRLLNRAKGREEIAATFAGFSFVSITCLFWSVAPFTHPQMMWPIGGHGLRPVIGLKDFFGGSLTSLWNFTIFGVNIPAGAVVLIALITAGLHLFFKTGRGIAMEAAGENETFARLSGIDIDRVRIESVIYSTVLAAAGICIYAQSYGFLELYEAPLMMAFPAASAVLIGGNSRTKPGIAAIRTGVILYQSIYLLSTPVANAVLVPETAEIIRMIISNSIILYAIFAGSKVNNG